MTEEQKETYYQPLVYLVPERDEGVLLKTILRSRMHISRKLLTRLKQSEQGIKLNGERRYIDIPVHAGDRVEVRMQEEISEDILPEEMPLDILFEDAHLLIVHKPAGIIVHPTHGHYTGTLANGVVWHWREKGETVRFRPVHRLDQETSGVLAIAKTPYVHQHISEQMQRVGITKEYLAIVHGRMEQLSGTVNEPIDRDQDRPRLRVVTPDGYPAVTHYQLEAAYAEGSLVRIRLETGRTHQIRVHMRHLGHPLFADKMYGPGGELETGILANSTDDGEVHDLRYPLRRQALHAVKLGFTHPITLEPLTFTAPLPADMEETIAVLKQQDEQQK